MSLSKSKKIEITPQADENPPNSVPSYMALSPAPCRIWNLQKWLSIYDMMQYYDLFKYLVYDDLFNIRTHHLVNNGVHVNDASKIMKATRILRILTIYLNKIKLRVRNCKELGRNMQDLSRYLPTDKCVLVGNLSTEFIEILALMGERLELVKPRIRYYECQTMFYALCRMCYRSNSFMPREMEVLKTWMDKMKPLPAQRVMYLIRNYK